MIEAEQIQNVSCEDKKRKAREAIDAVDGTLPDDHAEHADGEEFEIRALPGMLFEEIDRREQGDGDDGQELLEPFAREQQAGGKNQQVTDGNEDGEHGGFAI